MGIEAQVDHPIHPDVLAVAFEDNLNMEGTYRKQLTSEMLSQADYVVSFVVADKLPEATKVDAFWDVPDPRGGTIEVHRTTRDDIKHRVVQLADGLPQN